MILPIGHQEREVRRLPWVTISLIASCVLAFLLIDTSVPEGASDEDRLQEAANYWRERAYLEPHPAVRDLVAYDVMPNQRNQYLRNLPDLSPFGPDADGGIEAQQAELDRLTDLALGLAEADPESATAFERWGLVPASLSARGFVTHMFVHADWAHLIGNLFMLLLAGPAIEDRFGRALFGALYALSGLFAAVFYVGLSNDPTMPMVGASGAIAGVLGAFAIRLWRTQLRFAYFFMVGFRPVWGTFEAPAWAMLSLWFANEVFQAMLWDSVGIASGVAYWAHVGGFAFGAAAAYGTRALGFEERFIDPAVNAQMTKFSANPVLEEAMAARERGDLPGAVAMLEAEWQRQPDDELALAYWDAALASGDAARAAPAMLAAVRSAGARGEHEIALRHWSELSDHARDALADPATLMRFAPMLLAENQKDRAVLALRQATSPSNTALSTGQAMRVFEIARELDAGAAARAARRALASPDLHEAKRAKLQTWLDEHGGEAAEAEPEVSAAAPAAAPITTAGAEPDISDADLSALDLSAIDLPPDLAWGEDGVIDIARFARVKLTAARPIALEDEGLRIELDGGRSARIAWAKVQAVSAAIVADLAPGKPVLVIDLLANWNESEAEELRGLRLRSDGFDPRKLLGVESDPRRAFGKLVGRLLEATRAEPLPSVEQALGNPFARYETLAEYQKTVLGVAE